MHSSITANHYPKNFINLEYGLLTILGISFWFFLGFPFDLHSEYFKWVVAANKLGFYEWFTQDVPGKTHYQPLAQIETWLAYKLHSSIFPQQIYNYLGTILAWLILFAVIKEKKLFGWLSFIVVGGFFSGYKYLFFMHFFYTTTLIFLAFLLAFSISDYNRKNLNFIIIFMSFLAIVASLHHIFGLMLYVAFMVGYYFENHHTISWKQLITGGLFIYNDPVSDINEIAVCPWDSPFDLYKGVRIFSVL